MKVSNASTVVTDPFARWQLVADLLKLVFLSSRVANAEAPLNIMLVGPPGDGKTKMIMRGASLPHVEVLSDVSYLGVCWYLGQVRDEFRSSLVIPDMGTLVGRRAEVGRQTIATLAAMCAEGVGKTVVGKRVRDYHNAKSSIISAITPDDLIDSYDILNQNAFLSRLFLVDFDLNFKELKAMMERKVNGSRKLLKAFTVPGWTRKHLPMKHVELPKQHARTALEWWEQVRQQRTDRFFGFRSADQLMGLLMAAAYQRGARQVSHKDVRTVTRVLPLLKTQFQKKPEGS